MLSGDKAKTNEYDPLIADSEKVLSKLKASLADAMGIGSEGKEKDMLRSGSSTTMPGGDINNRPMFAVNNTQKAVGADEEERILIL